MIHIDDVLAQLRDLDGVFESYHVTTFLLHRTTPDGRPQTVTVQILDAGLLADPNLRYHCTATSDDGKSATGNPDSSIETALSSVHWHDLD